MKKNISLLLVIVLLVSAGVTALASDTIYVVLDGNYVEFDVEPQSVNGRTMVPIRAIFEKMGATVEWDNSTCSAICTKEDTVVQMTVNSTCMYVNNQLIQMDVSPVVIDGRTLAPARYVAEAFGATVEWDGPNNTVMIYSAVTLYALDGRRIDVPQNSVNDYLAVGWYQTLEETQQTLYATDGRTITVYKAEVGAYLAVGWYQTLEETQQTMYAADGRTITVFKDEVTAYKKVGWYETKEQAHTVNKPVVNNPTTNNPAADGNYYRTPTGKKYHLDPNCGGKNSYRTTNISGLTPCAKCAQ